MTSSRTTEASSGTVSVWRLILWIAGAFALIGAVALVVRSIMANMTADLEAPGGALWDFRDAGYFPVRAVLDGVVPYDVVEYFASYPVGQEFPLLPPIYMLLHAPFQVLGFGAAATGMFLVSLLGLIALSAWSLHLSRYGAQPLAVLVVSALAIVSNGGRNALFSGQASILFAAAVYLAITAQRDASGAAGVFLALGKPSFGLPVTALLVAAGRVKRSLVGGLSAFVVSAVLMVPFIVWSGGLAELVDVLTDNLDFSSSSYWIALETTTARVDATATAAMITGSDLPVGVELLVAAVVFGVSGYLLFARRSQLWGSENADAAVVLICVATLTGVYHSFYDLVLLVLPVLLVTRRDFAGGHVTSTVRYALLGALLVAAFNPFRFGPIVDILDESDRMLRLLSPGITGLALVVALGFAWYTVRAIPVSGHSVRTESD